MLCTIHCKRLMSWGSPAFKSARPPRCAAEAAVSGDALVVSGSHTSSEHSPATTLFALERTIQQRRDAMAAPKGGWVGGRVAGRAQHHAGAPCGQAEGARAGGRAGGKVGGAFLSPLAHGDTAPERAGTNSPSFPRASWLANRGDRTACMTARCTPLAA